jgi:copper resistance protein B
MRLRFVLIAVTLASLTFVHSAAAHDDQGGATEAAPFGAPVQDEHIYYHLLFDEFEGRFGADNSFRWEGEAWAGTDENRLWLKTEGEQTGNRLEDGEQEIFYDRPITTFFDIQAGIRSDVDSRTGRTWAALGIEGLAPMFFQTSATGYVDDKGRLAAKLEGSYDLLLTQRLILQPQAELNFYSRDDPARRLGSGLSDIDLGLRLRYEILRKFAPYVGFTFENKFGDTATFARADGERRAELRLATGIRIWF